MSRLVTISTRLAGNQVEQIDAVASELKLDRSAAIRQILDLGLKEWLIRRAVELLKTRKVTVWRAAEMAGVGYREMLRIMRERGITYPLSVEELRIELSGLK